LKTKIKSSHRKWWEEIGSISGPQIDPTFPSHCLHYIWILISINQKQNENEKYKIARKCWNCIWHFITILCLMFYSNKISIADQKEIFSQKKMEKVESSLKPQVDPTFSLPLIKNKMKMLNSKWRQNVGSTSNGLKVERTLTCHFLCYIFILIKKGKG